MSTKNREDLDSGEAVAGNDGRRGDRPEGGLSDLRRDNDPTGNDVRRPQLSRVQQRTPADNDERLQKSIKSMEEKPTALDLEIEKLNAYRQLAKKHLGMRSTSSEVEEAVNKEFHDWVNDRILELMGKKLALEPAFVVPTHILDISAEDVEILKGFIAQLKERNKKITPTPTPTAGQTVNAPREAPSPLKPSLDTKAYNEQQRRILAEVQRLAEMDRSGPEF